jgi:hypothetical protein
MVAVFKTRLLQVDGGGEVEEGWSDTPVALAMHSRILPACRCPMMKMWAAFASSVPGLVVSALSVSDGTTRLCLVGKASGSLLHRINTCRWSMTLPRRRMDDVDDGVGVDVGVDSVMPLS